RARRGAPRAAFRLGGRGAGARRRTTRARAAHVGPLGRGAPRALSRARLEPFDRGEDVGAGVEHARLPAAGDLDLEEAIVPLVLTDGEEVRRRGCEQAA